MQATTITPETMAKLLAFPWSEGRLVNTKRGPRFVRKIRPLTPEFQAFFQANSGELYPFGISLGEWNGVAEATWWQDPSAAQPSEPLKPEVEIKLPESIIAKLMSWQPEIVVKIAKALCRHGAALDLSGTGVGKTYIAMAIAKYFSLDPIVVTTAGNVRNKTFEKACAHFEIDNFIVVNWDLARAGKMRDGKKVVPATFLIKSEKQPRKGESRFTWTVGKNAIIILDESQNARNKGTLQTELVQAANAAKKAGVKILLTSATPGENPIKFRFQGELLGLYSGPGFYRWAEQYGCELQDIPGKRNVDPNTGKQKRAFVFTGNYHDMIRLREDLLRDERIAGMQSTEIKEFPESLNTVDIIDMGENSAKIIATREKWVGTFDTLKRAERDASDGREQGQAGAALMERQKLSQQAELLKTGVIVELARDEVDKGNSVVIFVKYQATADAYKAEFGEEAVYYTGQESAKEQVAAREAFQSDQKRVIVLSLGSGKASIDLQDLTGAHPRVSFITPDDNAEDIVQALGRIPRTKGKTKCRQHVIYALDPNDPEGGIEATIARNMIAKVKQLDAIAGRKPTISGIGDWDTGIDRKVEPEQKQAEPVAIPAPVDAEIKDHAEKKPKKPKDLPDGIYKKNGEVYKVQHAVHGSGNAYAKILVIETNASGQKIGKFQYAPGAINTLEIEDRMTLDEAKKFGEIYGFCCNCGRTLTDENSIEAGIGPICKSKFS